MKTILEIEAIGDDVVAAAREFRRRVAQELPGAERHLRVNSIGPWVAEIIGTHPRYRLQRNFIKPNRDYSRANKVGSHGVRLLFPVEEGKIYEVHERRRQREVRYFCRIEDSKAIRMETADVLKAVGNVQP